MYRLLAIALVAFFALVVLGAPTAPTITEILGRPPIFWDTNPGPGSPTGPTLDENLEREDLTYWDLKPSWEVQPYPDGSSIIINGTVEQVYDKLKKINPNFDEDWKDVSDSETEDEAANLKERDLEGKVTCRDTERWGVDAKPVKDGIEKIRHSKGKPRLQQDPKHCSPVSRAAIYWCNDYDEFQRIPGLKVLANGAEAVLNQCTKDGEVAGDFKIPGRWRVSVKAHDGDR